MRDATGIAVAGIIFSAWALSLYVLLSAGIEAIPVYLWIPAIALQTFLHTGLFITAHDAMHGTVAPNLETANEWIGRAAVLLYALFSYEKLTRKHHRHHARPTDAEDPDYHDSDRERFLSWYLGFLREYVGFWQIAGMAVVFNVAHHAIGIDVVALNLFWVLPSLVSTLQLFYFGTYLPHRTPEDGHRDEHHSTSNDFSPLVSFLTCYHFGYHHEHHERPDVPWWKLPEVRRRRN
jgi:beta-carotene ketolase (CrtW type)